MIGRLISRPWSDSNSHTVTRPLRQLMTVLRDEKFEDNLRKIRERYGIGKSKRAFLLGNVSRGIE